MEKVKRGYKEIKFYVNGFGSSVKVTYDVIGPNGKTAGNVIDMQVNAETAQKVIDLVNNILDQKGGA